MISPHSLVDSESFSTGEIIPLTEDLDMKTFALKHSWIVVEKDEQDIGEESYFQFGKKRLFYLVSLNALRVMSGLGYVDLWNEIGIKKDGRIITHVIGSLPRDGAVTSLPFFREKWGMAQQIKELGVNRILSVVEKFELENQNSTEDTDCVEKYGNQSHTEGRRVGK